MPGDRAVLAVLATAGLIGAFMQTIVTPIIPDLPRLLHTDAADASWVLISTLLAAAISTPITGRLGDMFGKRRVHLALLGILLVGSLVSALSFTVVPMVIGRSLQGIGLGVIPLGISILRDVIHPKNLGGAVALVSATLGVGGAVGLPVAAWMAQTFDWHTLFWFSAVLTAGALVGVVIVVPVSTLRTGGAFDYPGAVGLALGLVGILLAISKGTEWGWASPLTLSLLIGGVVLLLLWGLLELRTAAPLIDLRVAARRPVLLTNLAAAAFGFAFFILTRAMPVVLEAPTTSAVGLGQSLFVAGLCLMPLGLVMFFVSPIAARVSAARGPRTSMLIGGIVVALGLALGILWIDSVWHIIVIGVVVGVGIAFAYAAMPTLIMRAVPPSETAAANGLNTVMRTLGSSTSATVIGVILASHLALDAVPTAAAFHTVFAMGACVSIAAIVITLFIPRHLAAYEHVSLPERS